MAGVGADQELLRATERWFLRRGLPHLIEGYRATEDVFTRSVGVLLLVGLLEAVNAVRLEWSWWQNALALLGGATLLVTAYVGVNRLRHRPARQRPDHVGPFELALFVVLPALVPLVFGEPGTAALTVVANVVFLGLVYLVTSYGLVPMTRWALGRTVAALETIADLIGRALPLLFALTILVFVNTEAWQVAAALPGPLFFLTGAMFVVIGLLFLLTRLPGEVRRVDDELGDGGLARACEGTPVEGVAASVAGAVPVELTRRQRLNVYLVFLFAQAVQAALVTAAVFAFFTVFGLVAIRPVVVEGWLGPKIDNNIVWHGDLFGHELELTTALLHVSGFVAFVAGFSFTVSLVTDSGYREEFFDEVVGDVRQALAVRTVYLALRERTAR
ncbi:MAG TPA: hypothetical protein VGO60_13860 [Iamia sp.]|nr:hypothetical protein [Iamia sp.]